MFENIRRRAAARSMDFRALFYLLALSISLQICAPAFVSASSGTFSASVVQSVAGEYPGAQALNSGGEDSDCCVFAAQHADRGQIVPFAVSVDFVYLLPVIAAIAAVITVLPYSDLRFEPNAPSASAPARIPIYLFTQRFRN